VDGGGDVVLIAEGPDCEEDWVEVCDVVEVELLVLFDLGDLGVDGVDEGLEEIPVGGELVVLGDDWGEVWWEDCGFVNGGGVVGCGFEGGEIFGCLVCSCHECGESWDWDVVFRLVKDIVGVEEDGDSSFCHACEGNAPDG